MSKRSPLFTVCILSLLALASADVSARELEDRKWIEVRTDDFRVYSTLSERKTIELVRNLDLLRLSMPVITNVSRTDSAVPTHIFALKSSKDFELFGLGRNTVGQFISGLRNNTILLRSGSKIDETQVILHEYVHFLMRNHTGSVYPRWFGEGFAEFLSNTRKSRGNFQVGAPAESRIYGLQALKWISPRQLLDPGEYDSLSSSEKAMFYAQSWALVHFLLNRMERDSSFSDDAQRYIQMTADGADELIAFENAYGLPASSLWSTVKRYLRTECCNAFGFKIDKLQPDFAPDIKKMSRAEVSLGLAQTAVEFGKYDAAANWYEIAVQDDATRPWAEAGLGDLRKFAGDYAAAKPHFENALALRPDDAYIQLDFAEFWMDQIATTQFPSEREDFIERARKHFVAAWKLDDTMPETYAMYGRTYLMEGQDIGKAVEMLEQAVHLHPSSVQIRSMLTEAYARTDQNAAALGQAQLILSWGHSDDGPARFARSVIRQLENSDANAENTVESSNR
jgi:tetratricopeptide (TPR) repeat protein